MASNRFHSWSAVLLGSLGVACSNSSGGASARDGGPLADGGSTGDDSGAVDGEALADGGTPGDDGPGGDTGTGGDASGAASHPVNLGTAGNYVILAKSGISTVPTSMVTGDLGVSPAAASFITGFSLTADATNVFSTSPQVKGKVYAADYAAPTPTNLTTAIGDMQTAFTDGSGRAPGVTELGAGNIGGKTLKAGVYKWSTGLLIPTDVTLSGSGTDVFIFQVAQNLSVSSATTVSLAGGALAKNVFWVVAGSADLGTTAHLPGIVLSMTAITLATGASIQGRLLAQTAVSIDGSTVVAP